ncbi:MAG: hypothetical protein GW941_01315 [Candidatus Pacebacteria bacterium]|nr:hypothetical protein [Candidatus Paceibacterota bacterium]
MQETSIPERNHNTYSRGKFFLDSTRYDLNNLDKIKKGLEEARDFTSDLDFITICYHGTGRSFSTIRDIDDFNSNFNPDKKINATNIGFHQQINRLVANNRDALVALRDREKIKGRILLFLEDLADVITEAERIVIFDERDKLAYELQKKLYDLILEKAREKGKKVFFLFSDGSKSTIKDLYQDLGLI